MTNTTGGGSASAGSPLFYCNYFPRNSRESARILPHYPVDGIKLVGGRPLGDFIQIVGPTHAVELFGIRLVGINADVGKKLLFTLVFLLVVFLGGRILRWVTARATGGPEARSAFWARQSIRLGTALAMFLGLLSIWFDDPTRLATGIGLVSAGMAFALQKLVTAVAGYFVILRGNTFNVGDRITMGGVRGDVIALDFTQTTIMEMGQPPPVQGADPAMWVKSRQYTGRVVTVSNARIFDEPVYNYTRDFPYLWEELTLPVPYSADRGRAEAILFAAAEKHTVPYQTLGAAAIAEMRRRYFMLSSDTTPKVFTRLTDNWLELTVRFMVEDHGIRDVKDAMSREILAGLDEAGIGMPAATLEIVGLPAVRLQQSEGESEK